MRLDHSRTVIAIGSLIFTLSLCFIVYLIINKTKSPPDSQIQVRYNITVQNTSNKPVQNATLEVAVPLNQTVFQKCRIIDANQPFERAVSEDEQQTIVFKWSVFPPHTTKIVVVRSEIDLWKTPTYKDDEEFTAFLAPERFIESDNTDIKKLAAQLKSENQINTAKRTFDWVKQNLNYTGYIKHTRGALYALKSRKGDCTEFACLFVALCRANGIPARVLGGFVSSKSMVLDLSDYHNWAQFFAKGRWHVADPQRNILMEKQETYVTFQVIKPDPEKKKGIVKSVKGDGLRVTSGRI